MKEITKIPIRFHAYDPSLERNRDYIKELGNYDWFLYQFKLSAEDAAEKLVLDKTFRTKFPPIGNFGSADIITLDDFYSFLEMNYKGWAPYASGMGEEKAIQYSNKLIKTFLACPPERALYINYKDWKNIKTPYLISGVVCILDKKNNEFFELIMGGTD
jgi:hypothetical protein